MKRIVVVLILNLMLGGISWAQKYSNEFLSIGVGARARAMGNVTVASVNDVTAAYWNPAGLADLPNDGIQLGAMHTEQFAGIAKYDYLGVAIPLADKNRHIGLSLIRFGIDDIPNTLSLFEADGSINYDNIVSFSAADYAFLASYAQKLPFKKGNLSVGGNVKVIYRTIGPFANSWGFGLDAGLKYTSGKWMFGLMAKDITTTFNAWSFDFTDEEKEVLSLTGNDIPINSVEITKPQFILGVAYKHNFKTISVLTEANIAATTDGKRNTLLSADPISLDPTLGLEIGYKDFIFFRAGTSHLQQDQDFRGDKTWTVQPNLGVGLRVLKFRIDYAYTDVGDSDNNTYSHVISLIMDIKRKEK